MKNDVESRIKQAIEKIRPFIQRDGGDVEFHSFIDGIVFVVFKGACLGCTMIDSTLQDGLGTLIMEEVPEVKEVRLAESPIEG